MKKTNHFYRFCALALSCLLLISLLPVTQVLADGDGAIHIKSAEDLRSLAHSCTAAFPSRRASPPPVFSACCKRTPSSKT